MKKIILFTIVVLLASCTATKKVEITKQLTPTEEITAFQDELQSFYRNKETSPYREKVADFKGHDFFPVDLNYRVEAEYSSFENEKFFGIRKKINPLLSNNLIKRATRFVLRSL